MKKVFNVIFDYILPIVLILSSIAVFLKSSMSHFAVYISLFVGALFGGLLIYQSLKERNKIKLPKHHYNYYDGILVSDLKDNVNLDETPPQESFNSVDGSIAYNINRLTDICYNASKAGGWHTDRHTGQLLDRNRAEMLCLIHSEISEAMEGERKGLMDDHLPNRPMAEVELADADIRIGDYCGRWGYDLGGAIVEKLAYNATRADHKMENRNKEGGKKF